MDVPLWCHLRDKDRRETTNLEQAGPGLIVFPGADYIKFSLVGRVRSGKADSTITEK